LTAATLKAFLYNLGYTPRTGARTGPPYTITGIVNGSPRSITVTLSPEEDEIIVFTELPSVGDPVRIPASVSLGLLAENRHAGPPHFSFDPDGRRFVLRVVFTNGGLTPVSFRTQVEFFLDVLSRTASLWDSSKWTASPPAGTQTTEKPVEPGEKVTAETGPVRDGSPDNYAAEGVAVGPGQAAKVQELLDAGTDPNWRGPNETTLLMGAASRAEPTTVKILLAKGADPNLQNIAGVTALMYSIFSTGSYAVIEALVRGGADVDLRNTHGESAISYVRMTDARRLEILNLLVNAAILNHLSVAAMAQRTLADIGEFKKAFTNSMVLRMPMQIISPGLEPTKEDVERLKQQIERTTKERDLMNYQSPVWDEIVKAETVASQLASNPLPERVAAVRAALERLLSRCTALTSSKEWKELVELRLGHPILVGDAQLRRDLRHLGEAPR